MTDTYDVAGRLDFIGLDQAGREALRKLRPFLEAELGPALDVFYGRVRANPHRAATQGPHDVQSHRGIHEGEVLPMG